MTIALFGASGRTGKEVLLQALVKGYRVKALVRREAAIDIRDEKLEIFTGQLSDQSLINQTLEGCQAVLVALGSRPTEEGNILSESMSRILLAMDVHSVKRIIVVSSAACFAKKDDSGFLGKVLRPLFSKNECSDQVRQFELLKESDAEWILVRPTTLIDAIKTGKYHITLDKPAGKRIARSDVADFMLRQLNGSKYLRQMPIISY